MKIHISFGRFEFFFATAGYFDGWDRPKAGARLRLGNVRWSLGRGWKRLQRDF